MTNTFQLCEGYYFEIHRWLKVGRVKSKNKVNIIIKRKIYAPAWQWYSINCSNNTRLVWFYYKLFQPDVSPHARHYNITHSTNYNPWVREPWVQTTSNSPLTVKLRLIICNIAAQVDFLYSLFDTWRPKLKE
jgi:hypothetical protein